MQAIYWPVVHPPGGKTQWGIPAGPQTMVIHQLIGEGAAQKTVELSVAVPENHPAIEQIIDVVVRHLWLTRVEVVADQVIVCGDFSVEVIYVACLPEQPVHVVEARQAKFTVVLPVDGARFGMAAEAWATVEFVDYESEPNQRVYWPNKTQYDFVGQAGGAKTYWAASPQTHGSRMVHVTVIFQVIAKVLADRPVTIYPEVLSALPHNPQG
ncbi:MAG: DUF3794 domain-containing protein [Negativicutes bacterium]|nr:DUF3794 domain-containing protein [Negativicutes bacterium]